MACERWATIVVVADGNIAASWELSGCGRPTLTTVDALARLHLDARRLGWDLVVSDPAPLLAELLELAGVAALIAA